MTVLCLPAMAQTPKPAASAQAPVLPIPAGANRVATVNGKPMDAYFPRERHRSQLRLPLQAVEMMDRFDVVVNCSGGGLVGQSEAARLGLSRAIQLCNKELRPPLKKLGYLSRDSRIKERKKYGQKGARKRFQFSKR